MPRKSSMSQAEHDESNNSTIDPLIEALLGHLPASGDAFPDRKLWLQILDLSLQLIYPPEDASGG